MQVNFDKFSRIQPLDAPIRAEWFGVESFRRVGAVSRKTEYRISVLDEETLRVLENKKKAGRRILTQLSYPLGDDQRWMPEKVRPLFEKELARINNEGRELLNKALPGGVDNFLKSRREQVINDANLMYQEFHPGEVLSEEVITKILDDLKERLNKAFAGKFIPEVNYNRIGFHFQRDSDWVSNWGQPLLLLQKTAEFPRKSLTDSYFLQGLRLDQRELLEAMDVCDDIIVKESRKSNVSDRAKNELKLLEEIMKSQADNRLKCEAILALMAGESQDKIKEKLYRQDKVNGVINLDKPANKKQKVIQLKPR
ncbi:hypothetical protein PTH_1638 [Pelotomaculum thermopropionicum SI]|uniref:Uncharacterized protein n=1 Tax=Pelotomaculum thermopropionicum (strain DSM 13744 / JCM 10971 / SI) TaxID=370438 RepID=A5D1Q1_PELTS|nr:hypothetical protein PTH_1638 [Pelotomaculum thermopropionicum SI]